MNGWSTQFEQAIEVVRDALEARFGYPASWSLAGGDRVDRGYVSFEVPVTMAIQALRLARRILDPLGYGSVLTLGLEDWLHDREPAREIFEEGQPLTSGFLDEQARAILPRDDPPGSTAFYEWRYHWLPSHVVQDAPFDLDDPRFIPPLAEEVRPDLAWSLEHIVWHQPQWVQLTVAPSPTTLGLIAALGWEDGNYWTPAQHGAALQAFQDRYGMRLGLVYGPSLALELPGVPLSTARAKRAAIELDAYAFGTSFGGREAETVNGIAAWLLISGSCELRWD